MSRAPAAQRVIPALAALAAPPLLAVVLASAPEGNAGAHAPAAPPPGAPADVAQILKQAQRIQTQDLAAWGRYRFRRIWTRKDHDDAGAVVSRERLEFLITPREGGFDELLLSRNGAPPTPQEVERHRKEARFSKHYLTTVRGDAQSSEGGYSLAHLLNMSAYRYAGPELHDGTPCHRLDFSPDPGNRQSGLSGKFADAMIGHLWISADGHHLAGARTWTIRPVSIYLGLSKVHDLEISMESRPVADGHWLPSRIEVRTKVRVLVKTLNRVNTYEYQDYEPVRGEGTVSAGS